MLKRYILLGVALILLAFYLVTYLKRKWGNGRGSINSELQITVAKFSETFLDVGKRSPHIPVKVRFVVYNTGLNNLYIRKVEPDCHCTIANFSSSPISPKDSSVIVLQYDASNQGPFQSSAMVTTNSASSPTLLIFRGIIE